MPTLRFLLLQGNGCNAAPPGNPSRRGALLR
jgi:hypothetical protein